MEVSELKYWLWWNRVPGIGPARFFKLWHEYGSMQKAWQAPRAELSKLLSNKVLLERDKISNNWDPEQELKKITQFGFRICCHVEADYPSILKQISDPPPILYVAGNFEYGDDLAVAIIGTRNPTPQGAYTAKELAMGLSRQGITIVSGMARGIDSESHRGALGVQGRTIAVLGSGLDIIYPPENRRLMQEITQNGAVISEFPLGTQPLARNFPARNRIISGLSLGVVVVEAAQDSGSLITANMALEQGREVFAVPGSIGSEGSKGPHQLIRQGAKLVENCDDILNELAIPKLTQGEMTLSPPDLDEIEQKVFVVMSREAMHIDQIMRRSLLAPAQINAVLVQLELKGIVKRMPGQFYLRIK